MHLTTRKISSILMVCLLTCTAGACSTQEASPEESIEASAEQGPAEAPAAVDEKTEDSISSPSTETEKALAEASSPDFQDPKDVQLNENMGSSATLPSDPIDSSIAETATPAIDNSTDPLAVSQLTIYFAKNSSRLSKNFRVQLKNMAIKLKSDKHQKIAVSGHCDNRGSPAFNQRLALKRAKAVKSYLVKLGVASKQVKVVSYGKKHLATAGVTEEDHRKNRRVEIEFQ